MAATLSHGCGAQAGGSKLAATLSTPQSWAYPAEVPTLAGPRPCLQAAYRAVVFPLNWVVPWMQRREMRQQIGVVAAQQVRLQRTQPRACSSRSGAPVASLTPPPPPPTGSPRASPAGARQRLRRGHPARPHAQSLTAPWPGWRPSLHSAGGTGAGACRCTATPWRRWTPAQTSCAAPRGPT